VKLHLGIWLISALGLSIVVPPVEAQNGEVRDYVMAPTLTRCHDPQGLPEWRGCWFLVPEGTSAFDVVVSDRVSSIVAMRIEFSGYVDGQLEFENYLACNEAAVPAPAWAEYVAVHLKAPLTPLAVHPVDFDCEGEGPATQGLLAVVFS